MNFEGERAGSMVGATLLVVGGGRERERGRRGRNEINAKSS